MNVKVQGYSLQQTNGYAVKLRCPVCRQKGTFEPFTNVHDLTISGEQYYLAGLRRCPDPSCYALIFFVSRNQQIEISYPAERIDFDPTNIPAAVLSALEEAITWHAGQCFVAAALMVRKTLEELCRDRTAEGDNLKQRTRTLGTKIVLPQELLNGLDGLRLLGNDVNSREGSMPTRPAPG